MPLAARSPNGQSRVQGARLPAPPPLPARLPCRNNMIACLIAAGGWALQALQRRRLRTFEHAVDGWGSCMPRASACKGWLGRPPGRARLSHRTSPRAASHLAHHLALSCCRHPAARGPQVFPCRSRAADGPAGLWQVTTRMGQPGAAGRLALRAPAPRDSGAGRAQAGPRRAARAARATEWTAAAAVPCPAGAHSVLCGRMRTLAASLCPNSQP